jgi:hypothetical protein
VPGRIFKDFTVQAGFKVKKSKIEINPALACFLADEGRI